MRATIIIPQITNGKYVEGIHIYAIDLDATTKPFYITQTVLNTGNSRTCTINDLKKFRKYEFFLMPFYKKVQGKPSNSRIVKTMEAGKCAFVCSLSTPAATTSHDRRPPVLNANQCHCHCLLACWQLAGWLAGLLTGGLLAF